MDSRGTGRTWHILSLYLSGFSSSVGFLSRDIPVCNILELFQNRRGFKAILFFFLLCIVLSIIGTAVNPFRDSYAVGYALVYGNIDEFGANFIPGLIYEAIKIVSMYFTIHYISKYKLNLQ